MIETGTLWAIVLAIVGATITLGRLLERMAVLRRDLGRVETDIGEIKRVLYTTVGGRRAIRPLAPGELADSDNEV